MALVFFLIGVVLIAFGVVGWLFYSTRKEEMRDIEEAVVPVTDLNDFKTESQTKEVVLPISSETNCEVVIPPNEEYESESDDLAQQPLIEQQSAAAQSGSIIELKAHTYEDEIKQLKDEVKLIREKAVIQARNAIEVIAKLREANEQFQVEKVRMEVGESEMRNLKAENAALKEQVDSGFRDTSNLRGEVESLRSNLTRQQILAQEAQTKAELLDSGKEQTTRLEMERERIAAEIQEQYQGHINTLRAEIETLRFRSNNGADLKLSCGNVFQDELSALNKTLEILREDKETLEAHVRELESVNSIQSERSDFLQYELTKSRAQVVGFERAYENSRRQIDALSREVNASVMDNREIKKRAEVLERSLFDFKRLNGELLRQEKLSRFDFEKHCGHGEDLEQGADDFGFRTRENGSIEEEAPSDR